MDEMMQAFVLQRDKEFAVHVCVEYSKTGCRIRHTDSIDR
jgi:hypothetical protein